MDSVHSHSRILKHLVHVISGAHLNLDLNLNLNFNHQHRRHHQLNMASSAWKASVSAVDRYDTISKMCVLKIISPIVTYIHITNQSFTQNGKPPLTRHE